MHYCKQFYFIYKKFPLTTITRPLQNPKNNAYGPIDVGWSCSISELEELDGNDKEFWYFYYYVIKNK